MAGLLFVVLIKLEVLKNILCFAIFLRRLQRKPHTIDYLHVLTDATLLFPVSARLIFLIIPGGCASCEAMLLGS